MVQTPVQAITLEAFLAQPETKPASEYIEGQIIQKPMPQCKHSFIQSGLAATLDLALRKPKIARAATELRCTFGNKSIVPDIVVITWDKIPRDETGSVTNGILFPPPWMIEIISPKQQQNILTGKILHCLDSGTELGWIIDPDSLTVLSYQSGQQPQFFANPTERLPVPEFAQDLQITIEDLRDFMMD
ncbi:Uma2 family endonuclease [Geitlerinema sp. P-1104]|uniref:Uma2 family endonuclease n=1 Tax=Geitlerinema sp. P-1104 TaxID=2546230 RepID=UPI00147723C2|nr:Uma2 family endonuclease [Geitlerinema sp. P-1104]NMG58250.1 Uma2 family endonuclease [Geitlerinema sp. P-1104]